MNPSPTRRFRRRIPFAWSALAALLFVVSLSPSGVAQSDDAVTFDSLAKTAGEIGSWSCNAEIAASIVGMTVKTNGWMKGKGDRYASKMTIQALGMDSSITTVVDGAGVTWSENAVLGTTIVTKAPPGAADVDGEESSPLDRFDGSESPLAIYNIFAAQKETLTVSAAKFDGADAYELAVNVSDGAGADALGELMKTAGLNVSVLRAYVGAKDGFPRRFEALSDSNQPILTMRFTDVRVNADLADSEFAYTPPTGAQVVDYAQLDAIGSVQSPLTNLAPEDLDLSDVDLQAMAERLSESLKELGLEENPTASGIDVDAIVDRLENMDFNTRMMSIEGVDIEALMNDKAPEVEVSEALQVGDRYRDFAIAKSEGETLRLSDFEGKVVLVDFWASWYKPCVRELPNLVGVYETFHGEGFEIVGVSLDDSQEKFDAFREAHPEMRWPQYFDGKAWGNQVAALYGVNVLPHSILLNREGKVHAIGLESGALGTAVADLLHVRR